MANRPISPPYRLTAKIIAAYTDYDVGADHHDRHLPGPAPRDADSGRRWGLRAGRIRHRIRDTRKPAGLYGPAGFFLPRGTRPRPRGQGAQGPPPAPPGREGAS